MRSSHSLLFAVAAALFGYLVGALFQHRQDTIICRHAIQRHFMKTRDEAEKIFQEQAAWESR